MLIWRALIEAYLEAHDVHITAEEIASALPRQLRAPGIAGRVAFGHRATVDAVRRVRAGESEEVVYREELSREAFAKQGITDVFTPPSALQAALRTLPDDAALEKHLERGSEEALSDFYRRYGFRIAARKRVEGIVREKHHGAATKREIWQELVGTTDVEILSPDYRLPFE